MVNKKKTLDIDQTRTLSESDSEAGDSRKYIGQFRILETIGQGGMGTVYLAEQDKPIRRKIALKVIKPGMDSEEVLARFESEQQALALMSHPHIAQVFESGLTEQGHPYFVMEYVPGTPVSQHCDEFKMSIPERLELFVRICEAVQHMHYKGIIHRDIKPSNVLVAYQDDRHIPKVIDFGIAKALTGPGLTEKTLHTRQGISVGTPVYMSPEQAELTGFDIDTRTDVYSLGVLLYELLAGATPFERETLQKAGIMEILRIIREVDPPKPSARLSTLGDRTSGIAQNRRLSESDLRKRLRGDLESIVMKCLEKDRRRRYGSVAELGLDVRRYLEGKPIQARPAGLPYKIYKFSRRHKAVTVASTLIFALAAVSFVWNVSERRAAQRSFREASFNYAVSLKEKAKLHAKEKRWDLVKLFSAHSLLSQAKARRFLPMGDIDLPVGIRDWRLAVQARTESVGTMVFGFHPDWSHLASSGVSDRIMISDISSGRVIGALDGKQGMISALGFSPRGRWLASAGVDASIKIWDFEDRSVAADLAAGSAARNLVFFPGGETLAAGCLDGTVKLWRLPDGRETRSWPAHSGSIGALCLSPQGEYLATSGKDQTIKIWDLGSGESAAPKTLEGVSASVLCFSPDNRLLAAGGEAGGITIWETDSGRAAARLNNHTSNILSLDYSPDGRYLASGSAGRKILIWDVAKKSAIASYGGTWARFHPSDRRLATHDIHSHDFKIWELPEDSYAETLMGHGDAVLSIAVSPEGRSFATGGSGKTIRIRDLATHEVRRTLWGHEAPVTAIRFSPDGSLLASGDAEASVIIWEMPQGTLRVRCLGNRDRIVSLAFSPDGRRLATGNSVTQFGLSLEGDNRSGLKVWDTATGKEHAVWKAPPSDAHALRFSGDGRYLAARTGSDIVLWDASTGEKVKSAGPSHGSGGLAALSPGGRYCADGGWGYENTARIWDTSSGRLVAGLDGHGESVSALDFSRDGGLLATGSLDSTIRLWDTRTGRLIVTLTGHQDGVDALAFGPEGKRLLSGSRDGRIKIWDLEHYLTHLWAGVEYPIEEKDAVRLVQRVENEVGLKMDGAEPASSQTYIEQAFHDMDKEDYEKAADAFREALDMDPKSVSALNGLGWIDYLEGKHSSALRHFERTIAVNNWDCAVHFNYALTHLANNAPEKAYNHYVLTAEKMGADFALTTLAIEDVGDLITREPDNLYARLIRGYLSLQAAEKQRAILGMAPPGILDPAKKDLAAFIDDTRINQEWKDKASKILEAVETFR